MKYTTIVPLKIANNSQLSSSSLQTLNQAFRTQHNILWILPTNLNIGLGRYYIANLKQEQFYAEPKPTLNKGWFGLFELDVLHL